MAKNIYWFRNEVDTEGSADMKALLGGKGANLAEMASMGIPVPPGFTITTAVCNAFHKLTSTKAQAAFLSDLMDEVVAAYQKLTDHFGYWPLVSVRSGAPMSMPGMMDTILNVGLHSKSLPAWKQRIGERAALDSYRRLIQMLGTTAYGVPHAAFDAELAEIKAFAGVSEDKDLNVDQLELLITRYKLKFQAATQKPFPDTRHEQLAAAVKAVFNSWHNDRAVIYREMHGIPADVGTAVNVQSMVFGNLNDQSGTGVLFSREPSTGEAGIMGEFLPNAQGEDVVAGIRTPMPLAFMLDMPQPDREMWQVIHAELCEVTHRLEMHYRDMMDIEFTVQDGKLFLLQCRVGKRSALAAFRIAVDLFEEDLLQSPAEVLRRLTPEQYKLVTRPIVDPAFKGQVVAKGLPACVGVASGVAAFSSATALNCTQPCILITHETNPDDIAGMAKAKGILTATGGVTSHAAVVARAMDKPCVTGCDALQYTPAGLFDTGPTVMLDGVSLEEGKTRVTICGQTGRIWLGESVPVVDGTQHPAVKAVEAMAMTETSLRPKLFTLPDPGVSGFELDCSAIWSSDPMAVATAARLAALGDVSDVVLDFANPGKAMAAADLALLGIFGQGIDHSAGMQFLAGLIQSSDKLKGLTLRNVTETQKLQAQKAGFRVLGPAKTVADLLSGTATEITDSFVQTVLGGADVLKMLQPLMPATAKPVSSALPLEYAVFKVLAQ